MIVRTPIQKAIGGCRLYLPHSGDMEMWLRFAANGAVAHINAVQAFKRVHASNMSGPYYAEKWPDWQRRKEAFDSFFKEYANRLPSGNLQARAYRALAETVFYTGIAQICRGNIGPARCLLR